MINPKQPQPALGRIPKQDERDRRFALPTPRRLTVRRSRQHAFFGRPLDQGGTSHCVEYSLRHLLMGAPIRQKLNLPFGDLYRQAQEIDEWPGGEPSYYGTSVRAGLKVLQRLGYIGSYHWAFTMDQLLHHILEVGPLAFGTIWHRGMFMPDERGWIEPVGPIDGGHAWLAWHVNRDTKTPFGSKGVLTGLNSWGGRTATTAGWGINGRFRLSLDHVEYLLNADGEVAMVVERRL